ncbi:MAG: hypothetical protein M3541_00290 [Acidobacteriota bacterium]|nr:hypothetical protein [Acidobacteriota bacterium]MDQ3417222.1 hypothetical protein [Acidobacteriota bacterium]
MSSLTETASTIREWREHPLRWFADNFPGATLDPAQVEALEAFASPDPTKQRISLQACAGPGKTATLVFGGLHFIGTQGDHGEHPKGAAVAITGDNLSTNLWPEFAKWMARSPYYSKAFTWTASRIFANDHPETWFLVARTWPKSANAEAQGATLSGLHSKYGLALIDESGAIPLTVLRAAEQSLSGCTFGKIMQAGNPISLDGMLYAAASQLRHLWYVIRITGDPEDPRRSPRIDRAWAAEQIATYGRDNPWVKSYILGEFPSQSLNALLGIEEVEAAMRKQLRPDDYSWAQKRLGIDCARFGDDRSVIFPRQGLAAFRPVIMRHGRGPPSRLILQTASSPPRKNGGVTHAAIDSTGGWVGGWNNRRSSGKRFCANRSPVRRAGNGQAL